MAQALTDPEVLQAALEGLKLQRARIESQIAAVESAMGGARRAPAKTGGGGIRKRRTMSAAARKRIAEAQKERWARYRKEKQAKS